MLCATMSALGIGVIAAIRYISLGKGEHGALVARPVLPQISEVQSRGLNSAVPPAPVVDLAPQTSAPMWLILTETRTGRSRLDAVAFIGTTPRSTHPYRVGALLGNQARLKEINEDYVVLERDGNTARLYVTGKQPATFAPTAALLTVGGPPSSRPALADSHDELTDAVRVSPSFDGNTFHGLIVYANPRSDAFSQLGFQPGDVITAIDGDRLSDAPSGIAALRGLLEGRSLTVTVERATQSTTFTVDGSLLASDTHPTSD